MAKKAKTIQDIMQGQQSAVTTPPQPEVPEAVPPAPPSPPSPNIIPPEADKSPLVPLQQGDKTFLVNRATALNAANASAQKAAEDQLIQAHNLQQQVISGQQSQQSIS